MSRKMHPTIKEFVQQIRKTEKSLSLGILSLGNPTRKYFNTRHNAGHMCLEAVKREMTELGPYRDQKLRDGCIATIFEEHPDLFLFQSGRFMNESFKAISTMFQWQQKTREEIVDAANYRYVHTILVLHDDVETDLGSVKFKAGGRGTHGHNGLRNIMETEILYSAPTRYMINRSSFPRIRIGIGRPSRGEVSDFVLQQFRPDEKSIFDSTTVPGVIDILNQIFHSGVIKSFAPYR